jgi:YD repeat-containing protein
MSNIESICEYDSNGKVIYSRYSTGYEQWCEYDSNGDLIHFRDSHGFENWWEYDSNGNRIHFKTNNGLEQWFWEGRVTEDPIKILILETQLHSKVPQ